MPRGRCSTPPNDHSMCIAMIHFKRLLLIIATLCGALFFAGDDALAQYQPLIRPGACTFQYQPVCAVARKRTLVTYGNACAAKAVQRAHRKRRRVQRRMLASLQAGLRARCQWCAQDLRERMHGESGEGRDHPPRTMFVADGVSFLSRRSRSCFPLPACGEREKEGLRECRASSNPNFQTAMSHHSRCGIPREFPDLLFDCSLIKRERSAVKAQWY